MPFLAQGVEVGVAKVLSSCLQARDVTGVFDWQHRAHFTPEPHLLLTTSALPSLRSAAVHLKQLRATTKKVRNQHIKVLATLVLSAPAVCAAPDLLERARVRDR
jgi:hypothetical protein